MKNFRTRSLFFPIALAVSVLLTVLSLLSYSNGNASPLGNAMGFIVTPFQSAVFHINDTLDKFGSYLSNVDVLREENERLREENASLKLQLREDALDREEHEWLYSFLEIKERDPQITFVSSNIIAKDSDTVLSFTLDKGSFHGVGKNMAVITDEGVVGMITEVGANFSRGISILNQTGSVGVKVERTGAAAVLSGNYSLYSQGKCRIDDLDSNTDIEVGDKIYTSGLGSVYPAGFLVGTVTEIVPDPVNYTICAVVSPVVPLNKINKVMIVSTKEFSYE